MSIPNSNVLIRDFRRSDLGDLLDLLPKSFAEEFEVIGFDPDHVRKLVNHMFGTFGRLLLALLKLLGKEPVRFFVAEANKRVVGTAIVNNGRRIGYISTVMVHPNYRRMKIATKLMKSAIEYSQKRKMFRVVLHVDSTNIPAKILYTRLGFKRFENISHLIGERDSLSRPIDIDKMEIRPFQKGDMNEVYNLIKISGDPDHLRIFNFGKDDLKTPLLRRIFHSLSTERKIVAARDGKVVGYAEASYTTPKEAGRILEIHVSPGSRSSEIERALVGAAIDQIGQGGVKRIRATVTSMRQELIGILENLGFRKHLDTEGMFLEIQ